jgi:hypothetical protein
MPAEPLVTSSHRFKNRCYPLLATMPAEPLVTLSHRFKNRCYPRKRTQPGNSLRRHDWQNEGRPQIDDLGTAFPGKASSLATCKDRDVGESGPSILPNKPTDLSVESKIPGAERNHRLAGDETKPIPPYEESAEQSQTRPGRLRNWVACPRLRGHGCLGQRETSWPRSRGHATHQREENAEQSQTCPGRRTKPNSLGQPGACGGVERTAKVSARPRR